MIEGPLAMQNYSQGSRLIRRKCSEAVKKNCNNTLKDWRKQRLNTAWKSAPTREKSRQQHQVKTIYQHADERTNARRSGPVQMLRFHTNQRRNICKRGKDQTGASTLSHDNAGNTVEKNKAIIFLVDASLWV